MGHICHMCIDHGNCHDEDEAIKRHMPIEGCGTFKQKQHIKSVEELKELCSNRTRDFFITLNFGVYSRKRIFFNGKKFEIHNYIDESDQKLTPKQLHSKATNIGEAIDKGALYLEYERKVEAYTKEEARAIASARLAQGDEPATTDNVVDEGEVD